MTQKQNERDNSLIALMASILLTGDEDYHDGDATKVDGEYWAVVAAENIYEIIHKRNSAQKVEDRLVEKQIEDFYKPDPEEKEA